MEDTGHQPTLDHERTEDATILIRSRSQSPQIHDDPSHETQKHRLHPQNSQFSITPSLNSSTAPITPIQPAIRVEIRETTKLTTKSSPNEPKSRREKQPSDSHTPQGRRQPTIVTDRYGQTPNKTTLSDKSLRNRYNSTLLILFLYIIASLVNHSYHLIHKCGNHMRNNAVNFFNIYFHFIIESSF